jgi:hypothetical protein
LIGAATLRLLAAMLTPASLARQRTGRARRNESQGAKLD